MAPFNLLQLVNICVESVTVPLLQSPLQYIVFNLEHFIKCLIKLGLDGIETHYPYDRFRKIVKFSSRKLPFEIAKKYDLIQTIGTDEHNKLI